MKTIVSRSLRVAAVGALICGSALHGQEALPWGQDPDLSIVDEGKGISTGAKVVLWPINRVADFFDMFSLQFGFGFGMHLKYHATRTLQGGVGAAAVSRIGFDQRHVGICNDSIAELAVLPFRLEYFKRQNAFGTFPEFRLPEDMPRLHTWRTKYRDRFSFGAEGTLIIFNSGWAAHPVEMPDFFLGLVGVDYMADDNPPRWTGRKRTKMSEDQFNSIKRVVIVPSRVVAETSVRMERADGLDVYYDRRVKETLFTIGGEAKDKTAAAEMNQYLKNAGFSLQRHLLEDVHRTLAVDCNWDVVDIDETMEYFDKHAVVKTHGGQAVKRLPNYAGLVEHYGADVVLDVRVWEWGIWRTKLTESATMRLDCEFKLIKHPENEVLLDTRVLSSPTDKSGLVLTEFAKNEGKLLVRETKQACEVVGASFKDRLVESK